MSRGVTALAGGLMSDRLPGTLAATHADGEVRAGRRERANRPNMHSVARTERNRGEHEALTAALFNATLRIHAHVFTPVDED